MKWANMYVCKEQYVSKDRGVEVLHLTSQTLCVQCVGVCLGEGNLQG